MPAFWKNASKKSHIIALDFSSDHILVLAANTKNHMLNILHAEAAQIDESYLLDGNIEDKVACQKVIAPLLQNCSGHNVALAIDSQLLNTHIINMDADINAADLEENVLIEAERLLPYPIEEAFWDFYKLRPNPHDETLIDVMLVAAPQTVVQSRIDLLEELNYQVTLVTSTTQALINYIQRDLNSSEGIVCVINFYEHVAEIIVSENDTILFSENESYTTDSINACIENLVALAYADKTDLSLEKIHLCGFIDIANIDVNALKQTLKIEVQIINPFTNANHTLETLPSPSRFTIASAIAAEALLS